MLLPAPTHQILRLKFPKIIDNLKNLLVKACKVLPGTQVVSEQTYTLTYAQPKWVWTNHTAVRRVDMYRCQGHEYALHTVKSCSDHRW